AEINGRPRLMCMTRMSDVVEETPKGQPIEIRPMKAFPHIKDLVTDVSWNYEVAQRIAPIRGPEEPNWKFNQTEAHRVQHFRECIECFLCVNTCHVLRDHQEFDAFAGPRNLVRLAQYEMHPLDLEDRIPEIRKEFGVEYCNITRCCTEVCPAGIQITDDAIIQLKERVVDRYYDPLQRIWRTITGKKVRM
ncbi:MAG: 4Fe-4S dicluster domain-containing protein, partial [Candidatus Thermoplasmatota archaeon]|nr:4Fe-4S dicluster domain-containing protein [Candidatus Thermoplasmatota archaeon]